MYEVIVCPNQEVGITNVRKNSHQYKDPIPHPHPNNLHAVAVKNDANGIVLHTPRRISVASFIFLLRSEWYDCE